MVYSIVAYSVKTSYVACHHIAGLYPFVHTYLIAAVIWPGLYIENTLRSQVRLLVYSEYKIDRSDQIDCLTGDNR